MTEDRTLIISLGPVKECSSRQARHPDKQVVWLIAEKENVKEKQQKQDQGHIPGMLDHVFFTNTCDKIL